MQTWDTIVLGGGPAGLAAAWQLARRGIRVLLVEKDTIGTTSKTWLSFPHVLDRFGLGDCVLASPARVEFSSYLGARYSMPGDFLYALREEAALHSLAAAARAAGAELHEQEVYCSVHNNQPEYLVVTTSRGEYHTRLAIDCTGRESFYRSTDFERNPCLDMGCLAWYLDGVQDMDEDRVLLYDSFFPGRDYFWLVPFGEGRCMAGVFFFHSLTDGNYREKERKLELYVQARGLRGTRSAARAGNIPLGSQLSLNRGRLLLFGDSANTPLPSSGFSFSRCLEEAVLLSDFVGNFLAGKATLSSYKQAILGAKIPGIEVHLIISDMLSKFSDELLAKSITAMRDLDHEFIVDFLSGRDMSIQFSVRAITTIFSTYSIPELASLSLRQNQFRNLLQVYNLLPSLRKAKLGSQARQFLRSMLRSGKKGRPSNSDQ